LHSLPFACAFLLDNWVISQNDFSIQYSISSIPEDQFDFGPSCELPAPSARPDVPSYPILVPPPQEINYIGSVKRKARIPSPVLFASLLFLVRQDRLTSTTKIPAHIVYDTREDASQAGYTGLTRADILHFYDHCRTRFADFPGIDIGIQSSSIATSPDVTLCQPSSYKLGTVSGQWQGSSTVCVFALFIVEGAMILILRRLDPRKRTLPELDNW
jgi:hypothetical protein